MSMPIDSLPDDPTLLKRMMLEQANTIEHLETRNQFLEEQFRLAQQKQFGRNSEGYPGQGELFNEAEALVVEADAPEQEDIRSPPDIRLQPLSRFVYMLQIMPANPAYCALRYRFSAR